MRTTRPFVHQRRSRRSMFETLLHDLVDGSLVIYYYIGQTLDVDPLRRVLLELTPRLRVVPEQVPDLFVVDLR